MISTVSMRNIINIFGFFAEYGIILYIFRTLDKKIEGLLKNIGYICLFFLLIFYISSPNAIEKASSYSFSNFIVQFVRIFIHWVIVYAYLLFTKDKKFTVSGYLAGIYTVVYLTAQNMRSLFILITPYFSNDSRIIQWSAIVAVMTNLLLAAVIRRFIPINDTKSAGGFRLAMITISIVLLFYFKWLLITSQQLIFPESIRADFIIYPLCASAGVFTMMFLYELNLHSQDEMRIVEMEQVRLGYELQNAKRSLQVNSDISSLYHDMKNHLLYIQSISDDNKKTDQYLSELFVQFDDYENTVTTGNNVADSLLYEKTRFAMRKNIRFNICMDLTSLSFIKPVDIITILGNAVDNAMEAVQKLPMEEEHIIYLKSTRFANYILLLFSNQFAGKLIKTNGILATAKSDPKMHGIGLSSIRNAVRRYGGTIDTEFTNNTGWFRLVIMIPLPETEHE